MDDELKSMGFSCGIVGFPNVGKSTLFNALTKAGVPMENYPFCTIDPHEGIVGVPDEGLRQLEKILYPQKVIPTTLQFWDVAGLVRGSHKGEGLGNQFLSHLRPLDCLVQVVRFFQDSRVPHVEGEVEPRRDAEVLETELLMADLEVVERRLEKAESLARVERGESVLQARDLLKRIHEALGKGSWLSALSFSEEEKKELKGMGLLTLKPMIYLANVSEEDLRQSRNGHPSETLQRFISWSRERERVVIPACVRLEEEISCLSQDEQEAYLKETGIDELSLSSLIRSTYRLLSLLTFYTCANMILQAWTITKGATAPEAAGKVHSDMQEGFIKAEVIGYRDLVAAGSLHAARERGKLRIEGKKYPVQDGDLLYFFFQPQ